MSIEERRGREGLGNRRWRREGGKRVDSPFLFMLGVSCIEDVDLFLSLLFSVYSN